MEYETSKGDEYSLILEGVLKDRVDRLWEYYGRAKAEVRHLRCAEIALR